jgi:hypothetical protein
MPGIDVQYDVGQLRARTASLPAASPRPDVRRALEQQPEAHADHRVVITSITRSGSASSRHLRVHRLSAGDRARTG